MLELPAWWYEDDEWRGFVLRDSQRSLLDRHVFVTWVAGVQHRIEDARLPFFDPGKPLTLVPDPNNPFDPNALAVFDEEGKAQAGFVPLTITSRMPNVPDRSGLSLAEHLEAGERVGLKIVVSRQPVTVRPIAPGPEDAERIRRTVHQSKRQHRKAIEMWRLPTPEDPVEQMRRMMEAFDASDSSESGPGSDRPEP